MLHIENRNYNTITLTSDTDPVVILNKVIPKWKHILTITDMGVIVHN